MKCVSIVERLLGKGKGAAPCPVDNERPIAFVSDGYNSWRVVWADEAGGEAADVA